MLTGEHHLCQPAHINAVLARLVQVHWVLIMHSRAPEPSRLRSPLSPCLSVAALPAVPKSCRPSSSEEAIELALLQDGLRLTGCAAAQLRDAEGR